MTAAIDVLVIGGGAAGAAAALQLGRVRRSVVVVDAGEPRNAPAAHLQGYLGHDGLPPAAFTKIAHAELEAYDVAVTPGRITSVAEAGDRLACTTERGDTYLARRVLLAAGLTDLLPEIDGVREQWGDRVIHCPWCHGWEVRDQRIAVIDTTGMGAHQALLFSQLSDDLTLIRDGLPPLGDDQAESLRLRGVRVDDRSVSAVRAQGDGLTVSFDDGPIDVDVDVAVVGPRFEPNVAMLGGLVEVADHPSGMGRHVAVDDLGATTHPLIHAAGNVADPMQQVLHAAAHGSRVATMVNAALLEDDIHRALRSEAGRAEWDERYDGHHHTMWSGRPNGSLVVEVEKLPTGRVLDVGCGEGADVIWLAEQGWEATGTDISAVAIDRARSAATAHRSDARFEVIDANTQPPPQRAFDLVTISYPAFERANGLTTVRHIVDAVAADGRLVVIGHIHDDQSLARAHEHGFDPNQYVSTDDIVDIIGTDFEVQVDEVRERPNPPSDAHHVRDRVLVARRTSR